MAQRNGGRGMDYAQLTKTGVGAGAALFVIGMLAEYGLRTVNSMTETLNGVFLTLEFVGPILAIASVLVFGIALPLTE